MITLEQAKEKFLKMIEKAERKYTIQRVWEISFDDPIYVMIAIDQNGKQVFPGEAFQSIRKADGSLVDFTFPATG